MSSSSRRFAIMGAIQTHNALGNGSFSISNYSIGAPISGAGSYHSEVNTLLAGSMMITLSFLVVGLCFFLHRKFKKETASVSLHALPWTDENLEVFTLSGQEEITGIYLPPPTPSPPPAYDSVVKIPEKDEYNLSEKTLAAVAAAAAGTGPEEPRTPENNEERPTVPDDDLPSYEAAMRLGGEGYL